MKRRTFLQTAGAGAAVTLLAGCRERETVLLEQAVRRGGVRDGWKPWVCGECAGGCGAQVRVVSAEAKKIEGQPEDPSSRGGLCALGQSTLQGHYDPDRPSTPRVAGSESTWDEALARASELLASCSDPGDLVLVSGSTPAVAGAAAASAEALGADQVHVLVDDAVAVEAAAAQIVFGGGGLPAYDLDDADLVVSFGAEILDTWRNPVAFTRSLADRDAETLHLHVGPRMSLTAAHADQWLALRPGTLGVLARALCAELLQGDDALRERFAALAPGPQPSLEAAAEACDVSPAALDLLVRRVGAAERPVIVVGAEGAGPSAVADVAAGLLLSEGLSGDQIRGRAGAGPVVAPFAAPNMSLRAAGGLVEAVQAAKVAVFVDVDPLSLAPASLELADAIDALDGSIVVLAEATALDQSATVVLPAHSGIERIQAAVSEPGGRSLSLSPPVLPPLADTRHPADIVLALATTRGEVAFEGVDTFLQESVRELLGLEPGDAALGREFRKLLGSRMELPIAEVTQGAPVDAPSPIAGENEEGLELLVFDSIKYREGRGTNRPWLQELPEPISTVMWQVWAQVSEVDAAAAGLSTGDWATLSSAHGAIDLPVVALPTVRPGVVEVPRYGAARGRFADAHGANVLDLLPPERDEASFGARRLAPLAVEISPAASPGAAVAIYGRGLRQDEHLPRGWGSHDVVSLHGPTDSDHDDAGASE